MRSAVTIAKVSGIDIRIHASFLLILAFTGWQWSDFGPRGALFGVVLSSFFFVCVVLHELGHSLVAQAFDIPVTDITLYPIGGVATLGARPATPGQEFLIALAGPAVNVVIAGVLSGLGFTLFGFGAMRDALVHTRDHAPTGLTLWVQLAASNVVLAVFNMIPALPMDGGRVLRAMLAWVFGQRRATVAAALIGRVLAVGLGALGLYTGNYGLAVIAVFVFNGAGAEVRDTEFQRMLDGVRSGDAVNLRAPRLSPSSSLAEAMQALIVWPARAFAVERSGQFVGIVTREGLMKALNEDGGSGYVAAITQREVPRIETRDSLEVARRQMGTGGVVAVFDAEIFLGLITDVELAHQLTVLEAFRRSAKPRLKKNRQG